MRYGDRSSFGSEVRRISPLSSAYARSTTLSRAILDKKILWCLSNSILGVSRSSDLLRTTSSTRSPTTSAGRSSSPWKMRSEYHHLKVASVLHDFLKDTHSHLAANIAIHWRSIHPSLPPMDCVVEVEVASIVEEDVVLVDSLLARTAPRPSGSTLIAPGKSRPLT